jgi:hypothetical protein
MNKYFLLPLALVISNASAISTAELCSFRGRFVESFAHSRDRGQSERQTLAEAKNAFRQKFGAKAAASAHWEPYVRAVYEFRDHSPKHLRDIAEATCLKEFGE